MGKKIRVNCFPSTKVDESLEPDVCKKIGRREMICHNYLYLYTSKSVLILPTPRQCLIVKQLRISAPSEEKGLSESLSCVHTLFANSSANILH